MEGDEDREIVGFRIESEIGRGGMGVVYLARQSFPDRKVALKLLSRDLASDPAFRERFVRESNAAASTEHPNIVPVYAAGEADGHLYLAMRYIEGTDLRSLLDHEGALAPERAARICAQIADALEAAHERGLINRDVKPGNILLDPQDRAYLADFGLIRRTQVHTDITKTGQFMGTIDYVAPEQIKGGAIDGRADIYSLGCVLYECLTGSTPFHRDTDVATIYAHLEETAPTASSDRPGISADLDGVVTKAMAKSPKDRFGTSGAMAEALHGRPVPPPHPGRRGALIGLVAGAVLLSVGIGIIASRNAETATLPSSPQSQAAGAVPLDSLLQIDPETGDVLSDTTDLPTAADQRPHVEVGEGGVWVLVGQNVVHVDPSDGSIVGTVTNGSGLGVSTSIAVGLRTVWVGTFPGIVRIDPADDQMLRPVRLSLPGVRSTALAVGAAGVAVGSASAWGVTSDGRLTRVDQHTGAKTGTVDVSQSAAGLATGFDAVWTTDDLRGTLTRVRMRPSPSRDNRAPSPSVPAPCGSSTRPPASLPPSIPPRARRRWARPSVWVPARTDIAVGLDAVWVANNEDGTISRIDPVTRTVETIHVGGPVASIGLDEQNDSLWVAIARLPSNG